MRKFSKFVSILLLAAMMISVLPLSAAAAESYKFSGTVGEYEHFVFFNDYEDIVNQTEHTGYVPGMKLVFPSDGQVALAGTPTQAGTYVLEITVTTQRAGDYNIVLTITIEEAKSTLEHSFYMHGYVGEYSYLMLYQDSTDAISNVSASIDIPGIYVRNYNGNELALDGTPTQAGEYCIVVTATSKHYSSIRLTIDVVIEEKPIVITKEPTSEKVIEGDGAIFIARADNATSYTWELVSSSGTMPCSQLASIYPGLSISGYNTDTLVLKNIPAEMNGLRFACRFDNATDRIYSNDVLLTVTPLEEATPVVTKHPTDETVDEDGSASFVAGADYVVSQLWQLVSPDGTIHDCTEAHKTFAGLKVTGAESTKLTLENIPAELDGYRVRCVFTAGESVPTDYATLTVIAKETEPTEEVTEPTEEPTEEVTEAPEDSGRNQNRDSGFGKRPSGRNEGAQKAEETGISVVLIVVIVISAAAIGAGAVIVLATVKKKRG